VAETTGWRLLRIGGLLAAAAVALQTTAHLVNAFLLDARIDGLNADLEGNVFTWASSTSTFTLGLAAFLHAVLFPLRRRELAVLAVIAAFLSLDDAIQLHERLTVAIGEDLLGLSDHVAGRLWVPVYFPLLLLTGLLLWLVAKQAWEPAGRLIRLGLVLLVASILAEFPGALTSRLDPERGSAPGEVLVAVEEGLELGGWLLAAVGLTTAVVVALMRYVAPSAAR
jgi:hypothetical protein